MHLHISHQPFRNISLIRKINCKAMLLTHRLNTVAKTASDLQLVTCTCMYMHTCTFICFLINVNLTSRNNTQTRMHTHSFIMLLHSWNLQICLSFYFSGYVILHFLMDEGLSNGTRVVVPGVDVVAELEVKLKASQVSVL